jgi:glycosyltransferase involved in cell wall biosynthesis
MKTIVVSAVNLNVGGTLVILRDCLRYLSVLAEQGEYRIVAIVYQREVADFPNITYIETQWPKKRWVNRLWYEYVGMKKVSKQLNPVYLWLSLHDTTPNVQAEKRAVYCHNSLSFYKWKLHDLFFAPKIALLAIFTKHIYQTNIHKNDYLIVQQQWFKNAMNDMFDVKPSQIIVAPPQQPATVAAPAARLKSDIFTFLFAGSPDSHKNFEIICKAADILENQYGISNFKVSITVKGNENKYASWLHRRWGELSSMHFMGFVSKDTLFRCYENVDCLIFPSKVETWGLPITEFGPYGKPMLLADLSYAHETAAGNKQIAFFDPDKPEMLAKQMRQLIEGDRTFLKEVPKVLLEAPVAESWETLFAILLHQEKS